MCAELDTLLSNTSTRNLFLDDVIELKEFLSWRIQELSKDAESDVLLGQVSSRPAAVSVISCAPFSSVRAQGHMDWKTSLQSLPV